MLKMFSDCAHQLWVGPLAPKGRLADCSPSGVPGRGGLILIKYNPVILSSSPSGMEVQKEPSHGPGTGSWRGRAGWVAALLLLAVVGLLKVIFQIPKSH
jgi:hypothetical protein